MSPLAWPPAEPTVAPSILSADFARLGECVDEVIAAGAKVIHIDVMDGHFVPPLSLGAGHVSALRERADEHDLFLDVHLMVEQPERHIEAFASAGADGITIHAEATPHVHYAVHEIKNRGIKAGVALCPSTPVDHLLELVDDIDLALCMTVNPGWGGQKFIPTSLGKLARLAAILQPHTAIEVDGGIDVRTAGAVCEKGARLLVAGSAVFGADDPGAAFTAISRAALSQM